MTLRDAGFPWSRAWHHRGSFVHSSYQSDPLENCLSCKLRANRIFCNLSTAALQAFERIRYASSYPKGAVLFMEGQAPRGIFVLCHGQVKLSLSAKDGKTFILQIAEPGTVLGLSATVCGRPYELTAETMENCQVGLVRREDFLHFLKENADACFNVAEHLSANYNNACHELRLLGLSHSEKLAKLLLDWSCAKCESGNIERNVRLPLSHEEIGQKIGSSRETVTRLFATLRERLIVRGSGSTLSIRNRHALEVLASKR